MKIPIYQIDAFTGRKFQGNPAAVCPLEEWLTAEQMQLIALENNLSETAFFIAEKDKFRIRWFTPVAEVDLCGHATLASAYVIFHILNYEKNEIIFNSNSGILKVSREEELLVMDFPAQPPRRCELPDKLAKAFEQEPIDCLISDYYLLVFSDEMFVSSASPDFEELKKIDARGVIISSGSENYDFVSRFFAPKFGINEDPVTGSAHTILTPYWSEKLGKTKLHARQISKRGGELFCEMAGDRVKIAGRAVQYLSGEIDI